MFLTSFFLLAVMAAYLTRNGRPPRWPPWTGEWLFFFERASNLASGVSPVLPLTILGLAFSWWAGKGRLERMKPDLECRVGPLIPACACRG